METRKAAAATTILEEELDYIAAVTKHVYILCISVKLQPMFYLRNVSVSSQDQTKGKNLTFIQSSFFPSPATKEIKLTFVQSNFFPSGESGSIWLSRSSR